MKYKTKGNKNKTSTAKARKTGMKHVGSGDGKTHAPKRMPKDISLIRHS